MILYGFIGGCITPILGNINLVGSLHLGIFLLAYPFGHHFQMVLDLLSTTVPSNFINPELIAVADTCVHT